MKSHRKDMVRFVAEIVSEALYVPIDDIYGENRFRNVVEARHFVFWYCLNRSRLSSSAIGRSFSMDHASVLYGAKRHEERVKKDVFFRGLTDSAALIIESRMNSMLAKGD